MATRGEAWERANCVISTGCTDWRNGSPCREKPQGDQSEKTGGEVLQPQPSLGFLQETQGKVNSFGLVSLNTSGELEAIRVISS